MNRLDILFNDGLNILKNEPYPFLFKNRLLSSTNGLIAQEMLAKMSNTTMIKQNKEVQNVTTLPLKPQPQDK